MKKMYQYKFHKQGASVALVALSKCKLTKAAQVKILNAYLSPQKEAQLAKATGEIVIYRDSKAQSSHEAR
jgi:hypothetical protein